MKEFNVSIIIPSRNDLHGGNPMRRLKNAIQKIMDFKWEKSFSLEIIIVEYNPPHARDSILSSLRFPAINLPITIITVPESIHQFILSKPFIMGNEGKPMLEFWSKNIGARRARGEWLIFMNSDDIISNSLLQFIQSSKGKNSFFGAERQSHILKNIQFGLDSLQTVNDLVIDCDVTDLKHVQVDQQFYTPMWSNCGDFMMLDCELFYSINGFVEIFFDYTLDSEFVSRLYYIYENSVKMGLFNNCFIYHQDHLRDLTNEKVNHEKKAPKIIFPLLRDYSMNPNNLSLLPHNYLNEDFGLYGVVLSATRQDG